MYHENCSEFGLAFKGPPAVRRERVMLPDGRGLSALVWGHGTPELVFLHGGAQNAHTWDTVALALGRPLLCIDLPSHGHSDDAKGGVNNDPSGAAADCACAIAALAPHASVIIGMSYGGLTAIKLSAQRPELVRRLVLVDVTPGVTRAKAKGVLDFVRGPPSFASFEALLRRTVQYNPTRSVASLRRGILHNARQLDDGSWQWRHHRGEARLEAVVDYSALWEELGAVAAPVMLVRGMRPQSMVDDLDEAELLRRLPGARVERVAEAGHSVQGDQPVAP